MERDHVDRSIEQWARDRPELDTRALEITARIFRLQRILLPKINAVLLEVELNDSDLEVLAALRSAGEPFRLTPTELHRDLLVSSGAMTNRIDRLERHGLVERIPDASDGRSTWIALTEHGRITADEAMDAHTAALAAHVAALSDEDREDLVRGLRKLLLAHDTAPEGALAHRGSEKAASQKLLGRGSSVSGG